jgi:hypothetical protein
MLRLKLTLMKDMCCPWHFPVCFLVQLFLSCLAYYFQLQRLQREFGDVSDGRHRLAAPDWLSVPSIHPLVLYSPMSW